jgi:Spy/CpxP family protein refolding chaperone
VKDVFLKNAISVLFVVGSLAASQTLPSLQQYSTQSLQIGGAISTSELAVNRLEMLAKMLSLNGSQQQQAKAILDEEDATTKPLFDQLKQASESLLAAQKAAAPDPEIDQLARSMAAISEEILVIDAKAQSKIYSELTADQKHKLDQLPRPFFAPSAPLLPPGPVFIATSGPHGGN